jgi:hypothetical protein
MAAGIQAEDEADEIQVAAERLRPKLEPGLVAKGMVWEDVMRALQLVGIEGLTAGFDDPEMLLSDLTNAVGPVAMPWTVARLRPTLEPRLGHLEWEDAVPALERVALEELTAALSDPEALVSSLLGAQVQDDSDLG